MQSRDNRTLAVSEANDSNFQTEVLESEVPVVVDFWAHWCGPCKLIDPLMKKLDAGAEGKIKVVKVEVDASPELVEKYGVYGLPTLLLVKDGEAVAGSKHEGAIGMAAIKTWLESYDVAI